MQKIKKDFEEQLGSFNKKDEERKLEIHRQKQIIEKKEQNSKENEQERDRLACIAEEQSR